MTDEKKLPIVSQARAAAPQSWALPSWQDMLAEIPERLDLEIGLVDNPSTGNDDNALHDEWRSGSNLIISSRATELTTVTAEFRTTLRKFCDEAEKQTREHHENVADRIIKVAMNPYWDGTDRAYAWYRRKHKLPADRHVLRGTVLGEYCRFVINGRQENTRQEIFERVASMIAGGADSQTVLCQVAMARARGKGHDDYYLEYQDLCMFLERKKLSREPVQGNIDPEDFVTMSEFFVHARGIADILTFGAFNKKFFLGHVELPATVLDSWIQETLKAAGVAVDNRTIKEVRGYLGRRSVMDDRPQAATKPGSRTLELAANSPDFGDVFVLDPQGFAITEDMRHASRELLFRHFGREIGEEQFSALFLRWAGGAVRRARGPRPDRARGYSGVRIRSAGAQ